LQGKIVTYGLEEIGHFFLNRFLNEIKIKAIIAKDYGVNFEPTEIFKVESNTKRLMLHKTPASLIADTEKTETELKWLNSVHQGSILALYRANLEFFQDDYFEDEIPNEQEILWDSYSEREVAIIPDTSALLNGLITRLIESEDFDDDNRTDLYFYLSSTVIEELQKHAMGRQKQLKVNDKKHDEAFIKFADEKRKARLALRTLAELVEYRDKRKLRIKIIETDKVNHAIADWSILQDAKSLKIDMPKYFVTNDLIQSSLADLLGLKTRYMYPIHLLQYDEISVEGKMEVGKLLYDLALQFGEIIILTGDDKVKFTLQSDWPNKMSPSWVNKLLYIKIECEDELFLYDFFEVINKKRDKYSQIIDSDPRLERMI
jgi:hypothetical protein